MANVNAIGYNPYYYTNNRQLNFTSNSKEKTEEKPKTSNTKKALLGLGALSALVIGGIVFHNMRSAKAAVSWIEKLENDGVKILAKNNKVEEFNRDIIENFVKQYIKENGHNPNLKEVITIYKDAKSAKFFENTDSNIMLSLLDKEKNVLASGFYNAENIAKGLLEDTLKSGKTLVSPIEV